MKQVCPGCSCLHPRTKRVPYWRMLTIPRNPPPPHFIYAVGHLGLQERQGQPRGDGGPRNKSTLSTTSTLYVQVTWAFKNAKVSPEVMADPDVKAQMEGVDLAEWFRSLPWREGHSPLSLAPDYEVGSDLGGSKGNFIK